MFSFIFNFKFYLLLALAVTLVTILLNLAYPTDLISLVTLWARALQGGVRTALVSFAMFYLLSRFV